MRFFLFVPLLFLFLISPVFCFANNLDIPDTELTWGVPSERVDGSPIDEREIKGYIIQHSYNGDKLDNIVIDGVLTTKHIVIDTIIGEYAYMIATITEEGIGPYSPPVILEITKKPALPVSPSFLGVRCLCENTDYQ